MILDGSIIVVIPDRLVFGKKQIHWSNNNVYVAI
jgi:hypothetical protein